MRTREKGIILLTTLIMTSLLSLIVLSGMQELLLQLRTLSHLVSRHQVFQELETGAGEIAVCSSRQACFMVFQHPDEAVQYVKSGKGCVKEKNGHTYRYVMEHLGIVPCLFGMRNGLIYGTEHFRVTVTPVGNSPVLQLRLANLVEYVHCDSTEETIINPGITSWRYLN